MVQTKIVYVAKKMPKIDKNAALFATFYTSFALFFPFLHFLLFNFG